jgi:iron complex outermembrane receptor protein
VLYGDKATGGVINIITDKSGTPAFRRDAIGCRQLRHPDRRPQRRRRQRPPATSTPSRHYAHTGGWRENSQAEQAALSGRGGISTSARAKPSSTTR